jgi:hypothetical protein
MIAGVVKMVFTGERRRQNWAKMEQKWTREANNNIRPIMEEKSSKSESAGVRRD